MDENKFVDFLLERFKIERDKFDRSGVYAYTQRLLAYNSNKIEGSTLTEAQTASLFDSGMLPRNDDPYRTKDIEEMNGHFLMFNKMIDTIEEPLSENLIKQFHYELKSGVFEDRANGYAIGDYKKRPNMIGMYKTVIPKDVPDEIKGLLDWYSNQEIDITVLSKFHAEYESIHPFQDGNGRTGRIILFRECLRNGISPIVIEDDNRMEYVEALVAYNENKNVDKLVSLFRKEQGYYYNQCVYFTEDDNDGDN